MIRNLNPIAFQGFGNVMSERAHAVRKIEKMSKNLKKLTQEEAIVYRAQSDVWMDFGSGMTVLSVSKDGKNFVQFEDPGINQTAEYINMPVYPEQGSIQYINDVLVVKLSQ